MPMAETGIIFNASRFQGQTQVTVHICQPLISFRPDSVHYALIKGLISRANSNVSTLF